MQLRPVLRTTRGIQTSDGAGVRLRRFLGGGSGLPSIDPFLMLDYFDSPSAQDYIAGFPEHPHRGFETVTYMLAGRMRHRDNKGGEGVIEPGGIQWMTAGRGLVHSEMPEQTEGLMRGFQLWVNLPAKDKMTAPGYQEFPASRMPVEERDGRRARQGHHRVDIARHGGAGDRRGDGRPLLRRRTAGGRDVRRGSCRRDTPRSSSCTTAWSPSAVTRCRASGWPSSATATPSGSRPSAGRRRPCSSRGGR